jgi:DNA polymerase III epsilon subunit-like protein
VSQAASLPIGFLPALDRPWVALDFETATEKRHSACQVAVVRVEQGKIVREEVALIKPPSDIGAWKFTDVHGITARHVVGAKSFLGVWNDLASIFSGVAFVVAHNATFDKSVLEACANHFRITLPRLSWECTLKISRRVWPNLQSHKLNIVSQHLGIPLNHHEALSDARACARILIAAGQVEGVPVEPAAPRATAVVPAQLRTDGEIDEFEVDYDPDQEVPAKVEIERAPESAPVLTRRLEPDASTLVDVLMPLSLGLRVTPTGAQIFTCSRCNVPELVHGYSGVKLHQMLSHAFARHTTCEPRAASTPTSAPVATSGGTEAKPSVDAVASVSAESVASALSAPEPAKTSSSNESSTSETSQSASAFLPSDQQRAFFDLLRDGQGNIALEARAGTGKTTTLVRALSDGYARVDGALFLAFNAQIASELRSRAPSWTEVRTLNALGKQLMSEKYGANTVDQRKEFRICEEIVAELEGEAKAFWTRARVFVVVGVVKKAFESVHLPPRSLPPLLIPVVRDEVPGKGRFFDEETLEQAWKTLGAFYSMAIEIIRRAWLDTARLSFSEQVWRAFHANLFRPCWPLVLVDEAQDLNELQIEIVCRLAGEGVRVVVVGDPRQAIYQWRGAHSAAFSQLVRRLNAQVLPLTVTRRCGTAIVNLAKRIVRDFEAAPGAHAGKIEELETDDMYDQAAPGDIIVSRSNNPLVRVCLRLLAKGLPVTLVGRDVSSSLSSIGDLAPKSDSLLDLGKRVNARYEFRIKMAEERGDPVGELEDERQCVQAVIGAASSLDDALERVRLLVQASTDENGDTSKIRLMSTHKAKGLEADRVWVLAWTYRVPSSRSGAPTTDIRPRKGQPSPSAAQTEEEENLWYVGITRAARELFLVRDPNAGKTSSLFGRSLS